MLLNLRELPATGRIGPQSPFACANATPWRPGFPAADAFRNQAERGLQGVELRNGSCPDLRARSACGMKFSSRARSGFRSRVRSRFESACRHVMPARETEAIILKTFPLGEADRLVSFLGRASGKIRGVAAGARRLKNRFGSTLELLSHVQLWYVERETRELVRIQQCELLESFHRAQSEYSLSTGLAAVSEIVERVVPEREVAEQTFRLVLLTARDVERRGDWRLPLAYFAYWTVRLGGWLPPLDRCVNCGTPLGASGGFHWALGAGVYCQNCRRAGMRQLDPAARLAAEQFATRGLDKLDVPTVEQQAAHDLREAALNWIEFHTERRLLTRELLESA